MKNFLILTEPEEIFNYIGNLWRSDIFRKSHNEQNGYINNLIKQLSQTPRIFFDMHMEILEMVHFSSWFHAIQHRKNYKNDIFHDLYYHHEFYHLITMTYSNKFTFSQWFNKMKLNEFWASLESESLIYFYLPELRPLSFKNEIWVDKFLKNPEYKGLFGKYEKFKTIESEKLRLQIAFERDCCEYNPIRALDFEIASYSLSSKKWADIWQKNNAWNNVEKHIFNYLNIENKNKAIEYHLNWLVDLQMKDENEIAFGKQAAEYSEIHRSLFKSAYSPNN